MFSSSLLPVCRASARAGQWIAGPGRHRGSRHRCLWRLCVAFGGLFYAAAGTCADLHVAVAANFSKAHTSLAERFSAETGRVILTSSASSGKLYAQIRNGAPYDVFLSADQVLPRRLEEEGVAVAGSRFTYALGRLILWGRDRRLIARPEQTLRSGSYRYLAIANPKVAPYGAAARQVLEHLGLWESLSSRLVRGENVLQAWQFVASGNAELGLVPLSVFRASVAARTGDYWEVPVAYYDPIRQDAVLLRGAADNAAAKAYLGFLREPAIRRLIESAGYALPH